MNPCRCNSVFRALCLCFALLAHSSLFAAKTTYPQSSSDYHQLELQLKNAKPSKQKIDQLLLLVDEYIYFRKFQKADSTVRIIKQTATDLQYGIGLADYHYAKGLLLEERYKHQEALDEQQAALKVYLGIKDNDRLGKCYFALGNIFMNWNKYGKALKRYNVSLGYYTKSGNHLGIGQNQLALSKLYACIETWSEAEMKASLMFLKAEKSLRKANNKRAFANFCIEVSRFHSSYYCSDPAQRFLDEAEAYYKAEKDEFRLAKVAVNKGYIYWALRQDALSVKPIISVLKVLEHENDKAELGFAYYRLGLSYQNTHINDSAKYYYLKSLKLFQELENRVFPVKLYDQLADLAFNSGDHENAYRYLRRNVIVFNDLESQRNSAQARLLDAQYETEQRQKRMIDLDFRQRTSATDLHQQTVYSYVLAGGILLVAIIATLIYVQLRNRQRNRLIVAEHERVLEEQKAMNYRLQALSAQMNPHFIFNSLTSIQRFMLSNDIDNSNRYLGDFSRLMRQTLENSQESTVSLTDELEMLRTYLKLEQMRVSDQFDFEISIDPAINGDNTYIPTLLIQPYAENAIWHGIGDEKMHLAIHLYPNKDMICCSIDDNGVGRPKEVIQMTRKSYGMSITKARLELINILEEGQINVQITDKVDEKGNSTGTKVQICFPNDL